MADPLSVAASSFAAVGLADAVARVANDLYYFLNSVKSASTEIRRLRTYLQELESIVSEIKVYGEASKISSSPSIVHDVLPSFVSALGGLRDELWVLTDLVKVHDGPARKWVGKIKWVFEEKQITRSLKQIESHISALNTTLILIGR